MIYHHTGSKDTYITNKVLGGVSRATGANVGYASTLDLFKLHNESSLSGTTSDIQELSRALLYFDLDGLKSSIENQTSVSESTLKIELILSDLQGSQVAPANFTLELYPMSASWDEGIGSDISGLTDLQASNWVSRSLDTEWSSEGGDIGTYSSSYIATQTFTEGTEDLRMDVTAWVQAYWNETHANNGWALKFTAAQETNSQSYFVKRFASRHSRNPFIRPRVEASWENYHLDDRLNFEAGTTNAISISNIRNDVATALGETPALTLSYGAWTKTDATISGVSLAGVAQTGRYSAAVGAIDIYGNDSALATDLIASGSLLLQEKWTISSGAQIVHSGSFKLVNPLAVNTSSPRDLRFTIVDLKSTYTVNETPTVRLFIRERSVEPQAVRQPLNLPSLSLKKAYYQIRDFNTKKILIPFSDSLATANESTRISSDGTGMYFSFPASVLPRGRVYTIEIAHYDRGKRRIFEPNQVFRIQ
jgi:hypothetical protein